MNKKVSLFYYLSFSITIFLNAFLLFLVQPLIGKYILPWFGGTSFVWITSLLFFQTLLLGGYFYAYLLTKLPIKYQLLLHSLLVISITSSIVLLFSAWSSPITPHMEVLLPGSYSPALQVLAVLTLAVGLPYFLLSTTSTLLQKWFSMLPQKKSPYPLYALSNAGSLLAIITYPFLIEPFLSLQRQGYIWSSIFLLVCLLLLACTYLSFRVKHRDTETSQSAALHKKDKVSMTQYRLWLLFPAISSLMLLAGTHQLTQGIAPIPFLWLVPLGLYLLSYILCFSERSLYQRNFFAYCFLFSIPIVLARLLQPPVLGLLAELILFTIMLFSCFMLCHGELFATRPTPKHLNAFYLLTALGSVFGALIVAIIAPLFFIGLLWEFLIGLFSTTLIAFLVLIAHKNSYLYRKLHIGSTSQKEMSVLLVAIVVVFYMIISYASSLQQTRNAIGIWRNFYGTLRVSQEIANTRSTICLLNGKIIHGCQPVDQKDRMKPTTYYGEKSVGLAIDSLRKNVSHPLRVGALGLGVGTVASYGKQGDAITFYELNPLDIEIASKHFSYLSDTPAHIATVVGDGRLSMEKELNQGQKQQYNIFVIDAFNDDAIPVHLLTQEAFAVYKAHLAPTSIIAVHISNSYLDLAPVIAKAAAYHNMHVLFVDAPPANDYQTRSRWAFLTTDKNLFETQGFKNATKVQTARSDIRLWTDDYSNLFQIFKYYP